MKSLTETPTLQQKPIDYKDRPEWPGRLLSPKKQMDYLDIGRAYLYERAKTDPTFPPAYIHPLAPHKRVRSEVEINDWLRINLEVAP